MSNVATCHISVALTIIFKSEKGFRDTKDVEDTNSKRFGPS